MLLTQFTYPTNYKSLNIMVIPSDGIDMEQAKSLAELVYKTIRSEGTQKSALDHMQTREELYQAIDYYKYEEALDKYQGK